MMFSKLNNLSTKQILFLGSLLIFLISGIPYFLLNESAVINIHDNLDGEFVNYVMLKNEGVLFSLNSGQKIDNLLGGLPIGAFHSEFSIIRLMFLIFPPFWAYVFNLLIIQVIGFIGMYLLMERYILKSDKKLQSAIVALLFAFVPIYPMYGISVLGQPLIIWAFLNIRNGRNLRLNYLLLVLFPLYSHLALVGLFLLIGMFFLELHLSGYRLFKLNRRGFVALIVLTVAYILANFITLSTFISKPFIGHRTAYSPEGIPVQDALYQSQHTFFHGQYHSGGFSFLLIYIAAITAFLFYRKDKWNRKTILILVAVIGAISIFEGFYPTIKSSLKNSIHFFSEFEFCRFTFLLPFLIFVVYGFALRMFQRRNLLVTSVFSFVIFMSILVANTDFSVNWILVFKKEAMKNDRSYGAFFAKDQFSEIKKDLALNNETDRVACLGFFPSIAQYNGFYTLDGYENNYPLAYKLEFRKIISKELDKNETLRKYFDNWGSRCYLVSSETFGNCTFRCTKDLKTVINKLELNTQQMKKMKCKYILSSVEVKNASEINLKLTKIYNNSRSLWKIFVYQLV